MSGSAKFISFFGILAAFLLGNWILLADESVTEESDAPQVQHPVSSGILDGMTFASDLGPVGKPADVKDNLVFDNGMFVSTECERRCNYPASAYFVRKKGDATEFISRSRCPSKDATIVWSGEVKDGKIKGIATWTSSRWYWTVETDIAFEGTLTERASPIANVE
jgi:hypothetical protein